MGPKLSKNENIDGIVNQIINGKIAILTDQSIKDLLSYIHDIENGADPEKWNPGTYRFEITRPKAALKEIIFQDDECKTTKYDDELGLF